MAKESATYGRLNGLLVCVLYLAISLICTWPLALHIATHVIGPFHGDNLEYVWKMWWVRHAWFDLRISPWFVPHIYWPHGYPLAYGEITPLHTVLMLPVNLLLGEVCTYNLAILLSVWLSGWLAYLWLLDLTGGRKGAAFVGGLIFAFCPYRMARIAGHLPLVSTEGIPLVLWGLERLWRRRCWSDGLLIAVGTSVSALSSWYYALALALLVPVYWLVRARPWRTWLVGRWFWSGVGAATLITLCAVAPFALLYAGVVRAGQATVPLQEADFWSASLADYLLPNWRHPLWGAAVRRILLGREALPPYEFLLGFGYSGGILALLGWRAVRRPARGAIAAWTVVALVLSLGPSFHLLPGWSLRLPLPPGWAERLTAALTWLGEHSLAREPFTLNATGAAVIPLPALLVRWFVPAGVGVRSWGRFALFAVLGVAALAALGLSAAEERQVAPSAWRRRLLTFAAGFLVMFEFYTGPQSLIRVQPRPVDEWLAQQPGEFAIVQMPLEAALSGPQMFYSRYHGKNVIAGYGTYFPILFEQRYPELAAFPSDASVERLVNWPVRYVLVDQADLPNYPGLAEAIARQPRLRHVVTLGGVDVYALVADD
jgi:hypothetical protein